MIGRNPRTTRKLVLNSLKASDADAEIAEFFGSLTNETVRSTRYFDSGYTHNRSIYVISDGKRTAERNLRTNYLGD